MRQIYRYITASSVKPSSRICDYKLIGGNQLSNDDGRDSIVIRVRVPDDMKIEKLSCDSYSTTEDERTIEELGYDILVRINGQLIVRNDLKGYTRDEQSSILTEKEGLYLTKDGYVSRERYKEYLKRIQEESIKKEHETERIINELDNKQCDVHDLEYVQKSILLNVLKHYVAKSHRMER